MSGQQPAEHDSWPSERSLKKLRLHPHVPAPVIYQDAHLRSGWDLLGEEAHNLMWPPHRDRRCSGNRQGAFPPQVTSLVLGSPLGKCLLWARRPVRPHTLLFRSQVGSFTIPSVPHAPSPRHACAVLGVCDGAPCPPPPPGAPAVLTTPGPVLFFQTFPPWLSLSRGRFPAFQPTASFSSSQSVFHSRHRVSASIKMLGTQCLKVVFLWNACVGRRPRARRLKRKQDALRSTSSWGDAPRHPPSTGKRDANGSARRVKSRLFYVSLGSISLFFFSWRFWCWVSTTYFSAGAKNCLSFRLERRPHLPQRNAPTSVPAWQRGDLRTQASVGTKGRRGKKRGGIKIHLFNKPQDHGSKWGVKL